MIEAISGWIGDFFMQVGNFLAGVFNGILVVLPNSPFQKIMMNDSVHQILKWLNYFVPISFMLSVLQSWLFAISIFYLWQLMLRWVKAIE